MSSHYYYLASISFNNAYWDSLLYKQLFPHVNEVNLKSKNYDSLVELVSVSTKFIKHNINELNEANPGCKFVSFWRVNPQYSKFFHGAEVAEADEDWPSGEVVQYHIVDQNRVEEIKKENDGAIVSSFVVSIMVSNLEKNGSTKN